MAYRRFIPLAQRYSAQAADYMAHHPSLYSACRRVRVDSSISELVVTAAGPSCRFLGCPGRSPGLLQQTRVNLFIPPQLARALGAAGLVLAQTFYIAYRREARKLREEEKENDREAGHEGSRFDKPFMTTLEAVQVLGVERVQPELLSSSPQAIQLPLTDPKAVRVATENFERMFAIAVKHNNMFLAGKLSCAYRMCVDANWDGHDQVRGSDGDGESGSKDSEAEPPSSGKS